MTRVRFAPSPTGLLHLGNARTALFNWLFARHTGGTFILRVEDTDITRSYPEYTRQIIEDLHWLGLGWQEGPDVGGPYGPYVQSQRLGIYRSFAEKLLQAGMAYPCYCTPEELQSRRRFQIARGRPPRYDNRCRSLKEGEKRAYEREGMRASTRLVVPEKMVVFDDLVRGRCQFNMAFFGDPVIMKADATPTFHFAVVVDDGLMGITHVIRGEDHLTNTPLHILLFEVLGFNVPAIAHLPLITGGEGLLSKREGGFSIKEYRDLGYLPEAIVNYLLLLGLGPVGKQERFSLEEAVERFDISQVSRSPARFDRKKLDWLAAQYLREVDIERLVELALPYFRGSVGPSQAQRSRLKEIIEALRPGHSSISELAKEAEFFFKEPTLAEEEARMLSSETAQLVLSKAMEVLDGISGGDDLKGFVAELMASLVVSEANLTGLEAREVLMPLRLALTGRTHGPELNSILYILGKEECKKRLRSALLVKVKQNKSCQRQIRYGEK